MKRIDMKKHDKRKKALKIKHLLPVIIAVLGIFLYLFFTDREQFLSSINYVFSIHKNEIRYETFDIYLNGLDEFFTAQVTENLSKVEFQETKRFNFVDDVEDADLLIEYGTGENTVFTQHLLPVGHIYWIEDSIAMDSIENGEYTVLLSEEGNGKYGDFLESKYPGVIIESSSDLISDLEDEGGEYVGLIEDSELSKEYKLLTIDNKYYLDTFDTGIEISLVVDLQDDNINISFVSNIIKKNIGLNSSDFSEDTVAKINMTGVTALTRRVLQAMDTRNDYDYPSEKIAEFLADADITHTSNEVSFVEGCTSYSGIRFCSNPESIAVLKAIGVDIVELTGNHNNDYGSQYNTETIETYIDEGIEYFGGGLDSEDASEPYIVEVNETSIAFLGYNYYDAVVAGSTNALAGESRAGANPYSESQMKEDIEKVRDEVDIVIMDFQYQECYSYPSSDVIYPVCYKPISNQSNVFRKAIDYGADIVIGTQAHQPQTYELYEEGIIFYGLGNLFFDQSMWIGTRQGMILTHYFKDGELIQTKITPTMYDSNLQVEVADEEDSELLLELLSTARESL